MEKIMKSIRLLSALAAVGIPSVGDEVSILPRIDSLAGVRPRPKAWTPRRKRLQTAHGKGNWKGKHYVSYAWADSQKRLTLAIEELEYSGSWEAEKEFERAKEAHAAQDSLVTK
jgi:hypothetical protein